MKRYLILLLNLTSVAYADSVNVTNPSSNLSAGSTTSVIMHATTSAVNPVTYAPGCFPSTSKYSETLIDVTQVGGYGHTNSATVLYRCLRTGTKTSVPSYSGWQTNPYNSGEQITTSYGSYGAVYAGLPTTKFQIGCTLNITAGSAPGGYIYQGYGMNIQYNDVYNATHQISATANNSGGNCSTGSVQTSAVIPPGWIGIQSQEYYGAGGTTVDCSYTGYVSYFLTPANLGKTCYVSVSSPQGPNTGDGNHPQPNNCQISVNCY